MNFSDASAVWQAKHGDPDSPVTQAAWTFIEMRLDDYSHAEANLSLED